MVDGSTLVKVQVPRENTKGTCYHEPGGCGGHDVKTVEMTVEELADTDLEECSTCVRHNGLHPVWVKVEDFRNDFSSGD